MWSPLLPSQAPPVCKTKIRIPGVLVYLYAHLILVYLFMNNECLYKMSSAK